MTEATKGVALELFYGLTCPHCRTLKRMLEEVLPSFGGTFTLKTTLVSGPLGWLRSARLGIHAVPALVIDDDVVFRSLPTREELVRKLEERRAAHG